MFDTAELERKVTKRDFKMQVPVLRTELLKVQQELRREKRFQVMIVLGGVDGAGKSETPQVGHCLREFKRFLDEHDPEQKWCNMSRVIMPGHSEAAWVCADCLKILREGKPMRSEKSDRLARLRALRRKKPQKQ